MHAEMDEVTVEKIPESDLNMVSYKTSNSVSLFREPSFPRRLIGQESMTSYFKRESKIFFIFKKNMELNIYGILSKLRKRETLV